MKWIATMLACAVLSGCTTVHPMRAKLDRDTSEFGVKTVLSAWHLAASQGLYDLYFDSMNKLPMK